MTVDLLGTALVLSCAVAGASLHSVPSPLEIFAIRIFVWKTCSLAIVKWSTILHSHPTLLEIGDVRIFIW